ncbi:transposase [Xenorhabdus budapestensis]|uniref:transposase n=1 Tax=Xenorhabdus budapestensis TaxID=290110 RepID=UPI003A8914F6
MEKLSAGSGTKGERWYDWARIPLWRSQISEAEPCYGHYLLLRRNRDEKQERAYYIVYAREDQADLNTLVQVVGHRWEIERGFEETKGECGLDHYEVRQWKSWYRHITLSLLTHAVLAIVRL